MRTYAFFFMGLLLSGPIPAVAQDCVSTADFADDNAEFINIFVPERLVGGEIFEARVVMKNTGENAWCDGPMDEEPVYSLGLDFMPYDWEQTRKRFLASESPVLPGDTVTFYASLQAPDDPGDYTLEFKMNRLGHGFFGETTELRTLEVACPKLSPPTGNNAEIVFEEWPTAVETGGRFEGRVRVRNTGDNCWTGNDPDRPYAIGGNPSGIGFSSLWQTPHRHLVDPSLMPILPNEEVTLDFVAKAPASILGGSVMLPFRLQMIQQRFIANEPGYSWFGDLTEPASILVVDHPVDDAAFVDFDVPAVMAAGSGADYQHRVEVTMQNTGSTTWRTTDGYTLELSTGSTGWGTPTSLALPEDVLPNQRVTFELTVDPGSVVPGGTQPPLQWRMAKSGQGFGESTPDADPEVRDMSNRIEVSGDSFLDGTAEYVMRGFNYLPYYDYFSLTPPLGSPQENAWRQYDEAVADREFRDMARLGANTVRFWTSDEFLETGDPSDEVEACGSLEHALDTAYRNGIRAVLSFPINRDLLLQEFCPSTLCGFNAIGKVTTLFYDDHVQDPLDPNSRQNVRDFVIARNLDVLRKCDVLTSDRPRLFAVEFWQEPETGGTAERRNWLASRAWHGAVVDKHCVDGPGVDCSIDPLTATPSAVAATLANAFTMWDYTPSITCGEPRDGETVGAFLCAPDGDELCTGDDASDWTPMVREYRAFVDDRAAAAYRAVKDGLRALEDELLLTDDEETLLTLGFASIFARDNSTQEQRCKETQGDGRGYFLDPRLGIGIVDYASIHFYPWSDLAVPFDDAVDDSTLDHLEPQNRYHQFRFALDYIRAGRPVVVEEMGYNTCNTSSIPSVGLDHRPFGNPQGDCATRLEVQREVWDLEAENLAKIQTNGGL